MNKIKKTALLLTSLPMVSLCVTPTLAGCSKLKGEVEYHLLSINDVHGAMAGYGEDVVDVRDTNPGCLRLAREMNKVKKEHPGTIIMSAGDENSGDCWSVCDHAGTTYPILSKIGVQYAAVGNHAFEWGLDDLATGRYDRLGRTSETKGNYFVASNILTSNLYQTKDWCIDPNKPDFISDFTTWQNQRVTWADPYKIVNFGPATVCVIGLTTQNTLVDGNKQYTSQFSFINYNASIHYTKYLAKQELGDDRFNQIDSFILLTHCDSDYKNKVLTGEAVQLAGTVDTDIDAIISAHSHKVGCGKIWNNKLNKAVSVGQAGTECRYFLDTKLTVDPKLSAGKRVTDVSMSVHQIPIPTTFEEAQTEWRELEMNPDADLAPITKEYETQKVIVNEKVSKVLGHTDFDLTKEDEVQTDLSGQKFDGYYNSVIDSKVKIGHDFYMPPKILDHFGAWASRAEMLGFAVKHWTEIQQGTAPIPSAAILTQDSTPTNLPSGDIKVRNMFSMQPHDNYVRLGYLDIMQLANIINYGLSGKPGGEGKGFSYGDQNQYIPDLNYYCAYNTKTGKVESHQVAYNMLDENEKPVINTGYTCGMFQYYGIKMVVKKIDSADRALTFTNPVTGTISPVYDETAEYRVDTETVTLREGTEFEEVVTLPKMWVYDGSNDGKGIKWGRMDRSDDTSCWKSAADWYLAQHPTSSTEQVKLIPVIFNSFNYGGGNTQTRMFKQYCDYSWINNGLEFYGNEYGETLRDCITAFCENSNSDTREWAEYTIPTNIPWSNVKKLIEGLSE